MRSQALVLLLISCFFVLSAKSQSDELLIQGQTGKLYLQHTVVAKENWYSVGRMYNISPKLIAPYNNLTMAKPLSIGQQLQIPLSTVNFSQNGQKSAAETLVPVYHIVQEKEWMYRVSVNYNKVAIPNLEKWNSINKDQVKAGMHLIVGYLKVNTAQSALASTAGRPPVTAGAGVEKPVAEKTAAEKVSADKTGAEQAREKSVDRASQDHMLAEKAAAEKVAADKTAAEKATHDKTAQEKGATEKAATDKITTDKIAADKLATDKKAADKTAADKAAQDRTAAEKLAADKAASAKEPKTTPLPVTPAGPAINFNGGYFKVDYADGTKVTSGQAGTFKSTSGWQDGKYYALMNNIAVGTIVKITLASNNKSIYAKILGQLPDMKESAGLTVRISNAAASELGQGDGRFTVDVKY